MDSLIRALKALADPVRLRIVEFLRRPERSCCSREGAVCACDLDKHLGLTQPTVSHHMKTLVDAGLVRAEKHGRWVYYELNHEAFDRIVESLGQYQTGPLPTSLKIAGANRHDDGGV